jgi:hypothetical protein
MDENRWIRVDENRCMRMKERQKRDERGIKEMKEVIERG